MQFDILTLFPDLIHTYASESILGRAQEKNLITVSAHNFRQFSDNKWGHVDDKPYGGGPGMVLQVGPIVESLKSIGALPPSVILSEAKDLGGRRSDSSATRRGRAQNDNRKTKVIVMDPAGKKFDQRMAEKFAKLDRLVIVSGRYEGFDERVYKFIDEKVSVGDYVLAGGELAALTIVEAVSRLIPGVLGNPNSLLEETHGKNAKVKILNAKSDAKKISIRHSSLSISQEYPQYTRPEDFMGMKVPKVLLSGNHELIKKWREKKSLPARSPKGGVGKSK